MSKAQVMLSEKDRPQEITNDKLFYEKVIVGYDTATIYYDFYNNRLTEVHYTIVGTLYKPNCYLSFFDIDMRLEIKNGKPFRNSKWFNERLKSNIDDWCTAICEGELICDTRWNTRRTKIIHMMSGYKGAFEHFILYTTNQYPLKPDESAKDF